MATTLTQDLDSIKAVEDKLTANQVAQFAYTQEAYNDPERYADGVQVYNVNNPNNIPVADASILKVNETVLSKGYRSQASSITRMLLNHFLGRTSYNLNKANDLIKSLVTTIKANLGRANGLATLDANGRIPYSQLPETALEFKGMWDASANNPVLKDGSGERTKGDFYICNVAGTANFGTAQNPRTVTFFENDRVIYDGAVWQRLSAGDVKTVNSVQPVNGNITLTPADIDLGDVNNTSDMNKPVSIAQQEAINNAISTAENLANATGVLTVNHGGTGAQTPADARTQLGVDLELLKKANTIEGVSAVDTLELTANADVFIKDFVNAIIAKVPRDVQNSIVKFVTDSTKAVNIVFDSATPLPSGAVKVSSDGLIVIGNLVKMDNTTSNLDMSLIFLDKNKTFFTCRVEQDGSHVVTASISQSQASLTFDSTPTNGSSNPVTSSGIYNAIKGAVEALDVNSVGGDGKYIESISETDGKISATAQTMDITPALNSNKAVTSGGIKGAINSAIATAEDLSNATGILPVAHGGTGTDSFDTVPTAGSNKPVTSDGIRTAIDSRLPDVVNTGDSDVPEENGTLKFTTGGAFSFFQTENKDIWLGRIFGKYYGAKWNIKAPSSIPSYNRSLTTDIVKYSNGYYCGYHTSGSSSDSGLVELGQPGLTFYANKSINDLKVINDPIAGNVLLVATDTGIYAGLSSSVPLISRPVDKLICLNINGTPHVYALTYKRVDTTCLLELFEGYSTVSTPITNSSAWHISLSVILDSDFLSSPFVTWDIILNSVNDKLYFAYGIGNNNMSKGCVYYKGTDVSYSWSIVTGSEIGNIMDGSLRYTKLVCNYQGNVIAVAFKFKWTKFIAYDPSSITVTVTATSVSIDSSLAEMSVSECIALRAQNGLVKYLFTSNSGLFAGYFLVNTFTIVRTQVTLEDGSNPFGAGIYCSKLSLTDDPEENRVIVCADGAPYVISDANLAIRALPLVSRISTRTNTSVIKMLCHNGLIVMLCRDTDSNYYIVRYINNVSVEIIKKNYELDKLNYIKGKWLFGDKSTLLHYSGYEEAVQAGLIPE